MWCGFLDDSNVSPCRTFHVLVHGVTWIRFEFCLQFAWFHFGLRTHFDRLFRIYPSPLTSWGIISPWFTTLPRRQDRNFFSAGVVCLLCDAVIETIWMNLIRCLAVRFKPSGWIWSVVWQWQDAGATGPPFKGCPTPVTTVTSCSGRFKPSGWIWSVVWQWPTHNFSSRKRRSLQCEWCLEVGQIDCYMWCGFLDDSNVSPCRTGLFIPQDLFKHYVPIISPKLIERI